MKRFVLRLVITLSFFALTMVAIPPLDRPLVWLNGMAVSVVHLFLGETIATALVAALVTFVLDVCVCYYISGVFLRWVYYRKRRNRS